MSEENQIPIEFQGSDEMMEAFAASNHQFSKPNNPVPGEPLAPKPDPEPSVATPPDPSIAPVAETPKPVTEQDILSSFGFKTKDELKAMKEEYETLKTKPVPESFIDDPVLYGLNRIKKERPDDFDFFMKLKLQGEMDPVELLVNDYVKRNPAKKDNPDLVRDFIKRKYGLDAKVPKPLNDDDASPEEIAERNEQIAEARRNIEFAEMQMDEDVLRIKQSHEKEFESFLEGLDTRKPENVAEMAKPWEPVSKKFVEGFKTVPVFLPGPDGNLQKFIDFTVPQDQVEPLQKALIDYAVAAKLPMDESSVKKLYEFAIGQVYSANVFQINHAVAEKARSMTEEEYDKAYRNPSPMRNPVPPEHRSQNKYDESIENVFRAEGVGF